MKNLRRVNMSLLFTQSTIILLTLPLFLSACTTSANRDPIKEKMSKLDTEIITFIGATNCTSNNQCHSIGYGDKPCGGFSSYLIYSEQNTNVDELKNRVRQYNKLSKTWNRQNNISSPCDIAMPPPLRCRQQTCQRQ